MKVLDIYNILNSISPFELQAKWDNSGLNVGSFECDFNNIYVALELDSEILESVAPNSLVVVHHPLIFKPLSTFHTNIYPCNLLSICMQKEICVIAMHTNFDKTHLNSAFAKRLCLDKFGYEYEREQDFSLIYTCKKQLSLTPILLASHIKQMLNMDTIRYSHGSDAINNIYITCGSNASSYCIANSGDCIITGDIKYHDAMIAKSNYISFIDVPHFESECIFADLVAKILQKHNIQAIISNSHNPFHYV